MPEAASGGLPVASIALGLIGGLALFLLGLEQMTTALKQVAGDRMKGALARVTTNRFMAALGGAGVTAVIQSSSVTTVLVVGFISAGLLSLEQAIGVIIGANIGSTMTAQIIAFKVVRFALALVSVGFAIQFLARREKVRQSGTLVMGLGLIFFGMQLMGDATAPLHSHRTFIELMRIMDKPLVAILLSAGFTGLIQSSAATTGIIIVLASQGFISLEAGIALVFGANIGTCVTALFAAIGKPREAVRAAVVHVLFNVLGVVAWLGFIDQLATGVRWLSPSSPELAGAARLAAETPRQIANAHTIFNVANTLLVIGFTTPLARLVRRLVPDRRVPPPAPVSAMLDQAFLRAPALALDAVRLELARLGAKSQQMVQTGLGVVVQGTRDGLEELRQMDDEVDALHGEVIAYLGRLSVQNLTTAQSEKVGDYLSAANYIENIGDMIETNFVEAGRERLALDITFSSSTREAIGALHARICWGVETSLRALVEDDPVLARQVLDSKDEVSLQAAQIETHLARRLAADEPNRVTAFRIESDIVENLKRVYYFAKRIAKVETDAAARGDGARPDAGPKTQKASGEAHADEEGER